MEGNGGRKREKGEGGEMWRRKGSRKEEREEKREGRWITRNLQGEGGGRVSKEWGEGGGGGGGEKRRSLVYNNNCGLYLPNL